VLTVLVTSKLTRWFSFNVTLFFRTEVANLIMFDKALCLFNVVLNGIENSQSTPNRPMRNDVTKGRIGNSNTFKTRLKLEFNKSWTIDYSDVLQLTG